MSAPAVSACAEGAAPASMVQAAGCCEVGSNHKLFGGPTKRAPGTGRGSGPRHFGGFPASALLSEASVSGPCARGLLGGHHRDLTSHVLSSPFPLTAQDRAVDSCPAHRRPERWRYDRRSRPSTN